MVSNDFPTYYRTLPLNKVARIGLSLADLQLLIYMRTRFSNKNPKCASFSLLGNLTPLHCTT